MKSLKHASFPNIAERIAALYNEEEDALFLSMLGQEHVIRHDGIFLHGQRAPESHALVVLDYVFSSGTTLTTAPWRARGDCIGASSPDFRKRVEAPIAAYVPEIIARANALLPMIDAKAATSLSGSDMAIIVRALPKVYLRAELSQETQDFPADAWVLFSNNAHEFLTSPSMHMVAELLKDRLLSLLRIY